MNLGECCRGGAVKLGWFLLPSVWSPGCCFKDMFRRRHSVSISTGGVIHSLYVSLVAAVTLCPEIDIFHCANDPAVVASADFAYDSAILANSIFLVCRRLFLGLCPCFLWIVERVH